MVELTREERREIRAIEKNERALKRIIRNSGYSSSKMLNRIDRALNGYDYITKGLENVNYAGHNIISIRFNKNKYSVNNRNFSMSRIKKIGNDLTEKLN